MAFDTKTWHMPAFAFTVGACNARILVNRPSQTSIGYAKRPAAKWSRHNAAAKLLYMKSSTEPEQHKASNDAADNVSPIPPVEKAERARLARLEAEKLQIEALKAQLEVERAQLEAERKKLDLTKYRQEMEHDQELKSAPSSSSTVTPPYSPVAGNQSSATSPNDSKQPVNPENIPPEKVLEELTKPVFDGPLKIFTVNLPKVSDDDIKELQNHVFGMSSFFVTKIEKSPFGDRVTFRGNMRKTSEEVFDSMQTALVKHKLDQKVQLFLLQDPLEDNRPVVVVIPAGATPTQSKARVFFCVIAGLLSAFTATAYGIGAFGLNAQYLDRIAAGDVDALWKAVPIAVATFGITAIHDIAHRVVASMKNVKLGAPLFIPSLQLGTYGAITPFRSFPKNRNDLFDIAFVGPLVGFLVSTVALLAGLYMTPLVGSDMVSFFPTLPSTLFDSSLVLHAFSHLMLPPGFFEQATINVHPLVVVGYSGFLINALNMLPVGRLDGGRVIQAIFGRTTAATISSATLVLQGLSSVFGDNRLLLIWALITILLQREPEIPCQDEVSETSDVRSAVATIVMMTALLTLLPFPHFPTN
mmetsp:Transcript_6121/g.11047  ORF Transcript_6121/g.11047 Transcript_6121/m.11047 type:complete len:585 (-) Transcript_6121:77-1831(-)